MVWFTWRALPPFWPGSGRSAGSSAVCARKDLPQRAADVETLAAAGQFEELARLAHSLQRIGRTLGLDGFSADLRTLEQAAIATDLAAVASLLRSLPGGVENSIAAIREWLAARGP